MRTVLREVDESGYTRLVSPLEHEARLAGIPVIPRRVLPGAPLWRRGTTFSHLCVVREGCFKTIQAMNDGPGCVAGLQLPGDVVGMDAIAGGIHTLDTIAMEKSEVVEIHFSTMQALLVRSPSLLREFHRALSRQISIEGTYAGLRRNPSTIGRLSEFLVALSSRRASSLSYDHIRLRLSPQDVSSFLVLRPGSISYLLGHLQREGYLSVEGQYVRILRLDALRHVAARAVA